MKNSKTDIFLDKYRQLESVVAAEFELSDKESPIGVLVRRPEYRAIRSELDYCREVRNLLSHNPKVNTAYAVEPSDEMIALLDRTIQKIKNPTRARHIMVERSKLVCRTMNDLVKPTMIAMNENTFTHIPILENERVCGVFSENTILSYLIDDEIVSIDDQVRFSDVRKYLPINAHKAESFRFVSQNALVGQITTMFDSALKHTDRIGMIFVTNTGAPAEKLLGIITAWDVAGL